MKDRSPSVALVAPTDTGGGIENYSDRLATVLTEARVDVEVVPIRNPDSASPLPVIRTIRSIPPDVDLIHVQYEAGLFGKVGIRGVWTPLLCLGLRGTPVVTTIHEVHADRPDHSRVADAVLKARDTVLERCLMAVSDRVVVHTDHAAEILERRHGQGDTIETMRHPVDEPHAPPVDRAEAREQLSVETEFVVTTLGWVESKKRYRDVVEVLPELPDTTYLIAGEPRHDEDESILPDLFDRAAELEVRDRVRHLGYVPEAELPVLFGAADVTVLPYTVVTQSGALNTALAYRCPVVATALPAFREIAEEYNCVQTYGDEAGLAAALSRLRDPAERDRATESAATYVARESWTAFATSTIEMYHDIVESCRL